MKLYYSPGSCALAVHIVAHEVGVSFEPVRVNLASHQTEGGEDYLEVNSRGYVPALVLDDGEVLTEVSVLVQYLAELKPEFGLLPESGLPRYRVLELLTFISSELHKSFGPFFRPGTPQEVKELGRAHIVRRLGYVEGLLDGRTFLTGEGFSVADAYLWTVLNWLKFAGLDLSELPNLQRFVGEVAGRASVQTSLKEQGLI